MKSSHRLVQPRGLCFPKILTGFPHGAGTTPAAMPLVHHLFNRIREPGDHALHGTDRHLYPTALVHDVSETAVVEAHDRNTASERLQKHRGRQVVDAGKREQVRGLDKLGRLAPRQPPVEADAVEKSKTRRQPPPSSRLRPIAQDVKRPLSVNG